MTKLDYVSNELVSWRELFDGFDNIRAITFSSGIGFVNELLGMFPYAEIIFGCEAVMALGLKELLAFQSEMVEKLRTDESSVKDKMLERIQEKTAHFYVAKKQCRMKRYMFLTPMTGAKG